MRLRTSVFKHVDSVLLTGSILQCISPSSAQTGSASISAIRETGDDRLALKNLEFDCTTINHISLDRMTSDQYQWALCLPTTKTKWNPSIKLRQQTGYANQRTTTKRIISKSRGSNVRLKRITTSPEVISPVNLVRCVSTMRQSTLRRAL